MTQALQPDRPGRRWLQSRRSRQIDGIEELLLRIDAALVVRDPGNARSVDAYDGLRKQVTLAAGDRRRLLVMLSELAEALRLGQSVEELTSKAEEWMLQSNLVCVTDPDAEEAFEVVGAKTGALAITVPAYVDGSSGFIVRRGIAERTQVLDAGEVPPERELVEQPDATTDALTAEQPDATTDALTAEQPDATTDAVTAEQPDATTDAVTAEQPKKPSEEAS